MTRARTLIVLGVTVLVFMGSFTAGRALRPAGAPAAAAGAKTIAEAAPDIILPRLEEHGGLPPLRVPRPAPSGGTERDPAPTADPTPLPVEPTDAVPQDPSTPSDPYSAPAPEPPAPSPVPAPKQEPAPPAPEKGRGGGWSSGN